MQFFNQVLLQLSKFRLIAALVEIMFSWAFLVRTQNINNFQNAQKPFQQRLFGLLFSHQIFIYKVYKCMSKLSKFMPCDK